MNKTEVRILLNVAYSYPIIATAARKVQSESMWTDNNEIQKLKFSNKWVKKFLLRAKMYRRKMTKEDKNVLTPEEIKRILGIGQNIYIEKGHRPETCFNFDETAVTYAIGPTHVYCPKDQDRATHVGVSDMKVRITATIAVCFTGDFAPTMFIRKICFFLTTFGVVRK